MSGEGRVLAGVLRLERRIGSGGMGEVWEATHARLGARVAVKLLHGSGDGPPSPEAWARFDREARAITELRSPHVVQVLDRGVTEEGDPFLVMELLEGRDLAQHLEQRGRLSVAETLDLVEQLGRGLARAHELRVVHRDLKPGNVFLVPTSGGVHVKLLDFGLAKVEAWGGSHKTASGVVLGTPFYMSPEQLFEPSRVDHRADLWALAVIVYACLTGRVPFKGDTFGSLSVAVHTGRFDPPSALCPELPRALDGFMARALAPRLEERFASAFELVSALRAAASPSPGDAGLSSEAHHALDLGERPTVALGDATHAEPAPRPAPHAQPQPEARALLAAGPPPWTPPLTSPAGPMVGPVGYAAPTGAPRPLGPTRGAGPATPTLVALAALGVLGLVGAAWAVIAIVSKPAASSAREREGSDDERTGETPSASTSSTSSTSSASRTEPTRPVVPSLPSAVAAGRELSASSLSSLYAHAFAEARKLDDSARLAGLSFKGLDPQGRLASDGSFRATFSTSTWSCIVVTVTSRRTEASGGKCGRAPALRYPPRCSLKALRARIASADERVNVLYTVSLGRPAWIVDQGASVSIADDC